MRAACAALAVLLGAAPAAPSAAPRPAPVRNAPAGAVSAGTIPGEFEVTERGTASYKITVPTPPGTNDMTPRLALQYNNATQDGMLGAGWTMMGLPLVQRTGANIEQDGFRGGVNYDANDRFAYSGQRIIAVSGSEGGDGSVYQTELESWQRLVAHGKTDGGAACGSGPCWWSMTTQKGVTYEFGRTADSRVVAVYPDKTTGDGSVRVWALDKIQDLNGNVMTVTYTGTPYAGAADAGQYYPSHIDYTSNAAGNLSAQRRVDFAYEARPNPLRTFTGGRTVVTASRLRQISASVGGTPAPKTQIAYQTSPSTGRSRITSITLCAGDDSVCLPPTTFRWSDAKLAFVDRGSWLNDDFITGWSASDPRLLYDVNGDGRMDLVGFRLDTQAALAQPNGSFAKATAWSTGFGKSTGWTGDKTPRTLGDVTGDGLADVVGFNYKGVEVGVSTGHSFDKSAWSSAPYPHFGFDPSAGGWISERDPRMLADVVGDGRSAIVGFKDKTYVALSNGNAFGAPVVWNDADFTGSGWWATPRQRLRYLGDVNGDGRADVVGFGDKSIVVGVSTGGAFDTGAWPQNKTGFPYFTAAQGWVRDRHPRLLIDVNGDGLSDVVGFKDGTWVAFSTGRGFLPPVKWSDAFSIESKPKWNPDYPRTFADVAGSGFPSVVGFGQTGAVVGLNNGSSFDVTRWDQSTATGYVGGTGKPLFSGDVAGAALGDAVDIGGKVGAPVAVSVATAAGPRPDLVTRIENGLGETLDVTYAPMTDAGVYTPGKIAGTANGIATFTGPPPFTFNDISADFPVRNAVGGPIYLVKRVVESTDPAVQASQYTYATQYGFADAKLDNLSQRWLGFAGKTRTYENDGRKTTEFLNQTWPLTGTVAKREIRCAKVTTDPRCTAEALMTSAAMTYVSAQTATGTGPKSTPVWMVRESNQQTDQYTYGTYDTSTRRRSAYDQYGNPVRETYEGVVNKAGQRAANAPVPVVTSCKSYDNTVGANGVWRLGFLLYLKQTANGDCNAIDTFKAGDLTLQRTTYDKAGGTMNVLGQAMWDDRAGKYLAYAYAYDAFGNRTASTDPENDTSYVDYDPTYHAFVIADRSPPIQPDGHVLVTRYNFDPRFSDRTATVNPNGVATLTCMDALGRNVGTQTQPPDASAPGDPACVTSGAGSGVKVVTTSKTAWAADGKGGIYSQTDALQSWPVQGSPNAFQTSRNYLDGRGRVYGYIRQGDPATGDTASCVVYDGYDRQPKSSLPFLTKTTPNCAANGSSPFWQTRDYDVLGRVVRRTRPAGSDGAKTAVDTTFYTSYLSARQTLAAGSPAQYQRTFSYGMFLDERLVNGIVADSDHGAATAIGRDALGRIVATTAPATASSPNGITTAYTLDSLGRKVRIDAPDRGTITFDYGGTTQLQTRHDANGTETFSYDAIERRLKQDFGNGNVATFGYDSTAVPNGLGAQTSASSSTVGAPSAVKQSFGYDTQGNLALSELKDLELSGQTALRTAALQSVSYTTRTAFDPQARPTHVVLPNQQTVDNAYAYGNLSSIAVDGSALITYGAYDAYANPIAIRYPAGAVDESRSYSPTGQLAQYAVRKGTTTMLQRANAWNEIQELTKVDDLAKFRGSDQTQSYGYSSLRVTSATGPFGQLGFGYDGAGNLVKRIGPAATTDFTYRNFQIERGTTSGAQTYSATYDGFGSMTSRTADGATTSFAYDPAAELTGVSGGGGPSLQFRYDADGGRVVKRDVTSGLSTVYVSSAYQQVLDGAGNTRTSIVLADAAGPVATVTTGSPAISGPGVPAIGTLFLHRDQVQSTVLTTTSGGSAGTMLAYQPYGTPLIVSGPNDFRQKFAGNELDESGLYHITSRYLDPATGRFITADRGPGGPAEVQDSLNTYAYVAGRPTSLTDPSGQQIELIAAAVVEIGAAVGEAAAAAEGAAAVAETGAAIGETAAGSAATAAGSSEAVAAAEAASASSASVDAGIETTASTAARSALVSEETLAATTTFAEEAAPGTSLQQSGSLIDSTSFEAESLTLQCPSPCRNSQFVKSVFNAVDKYNPWSDRLITLYRGLNNVREIQAIENGGQLMSPATRVGIDARVSQYPGLRFFQRFIHSFTSYRSPWVSTTSSLRVASNFAEQGGGRVYSFEIPRYKLNYAWHSPVPWEFEYLAEDGTKLINVQPVKL